MKAYLKTPFKRRLTLKLYIYIKNELELIYGDLNKVI